MSAPLLLVDAGNTRVKWALVEKDGSISPTGDLATGEVTEAVITKLAETCVQLPVVISCVVPRLVSLFETSFGNRMHLVDWHSPLGYVFDYPNPAELGADRLAAASAVREDGISPAIIVQCGTATAFSVLDEKGRFCGGAIAPGPQAQFAALVHSTAQLPLAEQTTSSEVPGRSTLKAIQLGVMRSFVGGTREILRTLCNLSDHPFGKVTPPLTTIILTGGNAEYLTESLGMPFTLRPLLVFEGLRIIGERVFKT